MDSKELTEILEKHRKWLFDEAGGERADLRGADLQGANLRGANLRGAHLQEADLQEAHLQGAHLRWADLQGANLQEADLPHYQIPQHGELRVYKKVDGKIVHLLIPSWAKRTASLVGRKCRASVVKVLAIEGDHPVTSSNNGPETTYKIGGYVYPDRYNPDPRIECSNGIHFFLTREEAEEWTR